MIVGSKLLRPIAALALFSAAICHAQNNDAASSLAGCGCCGTFIIIPIVFFVLSIALLVWVARDAKARGMDSAVLWMLLVFFLNLLGLVIYIFSRPQGNLIPCPNCGNNRLQASVKCPHCGIGG
jgi:Phospholipase_D-nuclease N-terminal